MLTFLREFGNVEQAINSKYQNEEYLRRWSSLAVIDDDDEVNCLVILFVHARGSTIEVPYIAWDLARGAQNYGIPCYTVRKAIDMSSVEFRRVEKVKRITDTDVKNRVRPMIELNIYDTPLDEVFVIPRKKQTVAEVIRSYTSKHVNWDDPANIAAGGVVAPSLPTTLSPGVAYHYLSQP